MQGFFSWLSYLDFILKVEWSYRKIFSKGYDMFRYIYQKIFGYNIKNGLEKFKQEQENKLGDLF